MNKRGILIFSVALLAFCICACTNTPVENKIDNTKQVDINDEKQKAEKEKEKPKIEPLSEEQEKQQRKEKLAELTAQLEAAEYINLLKEFYFAKNRIKIYKFNFTNSLPLAYCQEVFLFLLF